LIRAGIFGLLRAVEKYAYKYSWRFSAYSSGWIRQSMREALAAQPRTEESAAEMVVADQD
jgi:DNA-directed RNA polymerase sigma subunit (sigma70/sigma32)